MVAPTPIIWNGMIGIRPSIGKYAPQILQALTDIYSTPEGKDLIDRAVVNARNLSNSDGLLHISYGPSAEAFGHGTVELNFDEIAKLRFHSPSGERNTSILETLVHEFVHEADQTLMNSQIPPSIISLADALIQSPTKLSDQQKATLCNRLISEAGHLNTEIYLEVVAFNQNLLTKHPEIISQLADGLNTVAHNPSRLTDLAQSIGIAPDQLVIHQQTPEQLKQIMITAGNKYRSERMQHEQPAVEFTDFYMAKYYGIPPRKNYFNGTLAESPADISTNPSRTVTTDNTQLKELAERYNAEIDSIGVPGFPRLPVSAERTQ